MSIKAILAALIVSQEEPSPEPAVAAVPRAEQQPRHGPPEELIRLIAKLKEAPVDQRPSLVEEIQKKYGAGSANMLVPAADIDLLKFRELPEADQARVIARDFFSSLLAGDASGAAARSGTPFMFEDRRVDHLEDVRSEWARHLRSKRTDLLTLYDLEVLTLAEIEKKYGRQPARLAAWSLRNVGTLLAVANVSGHAAVIVLKQNGFTWQVVAFHD